MLHLMIVFVLLFSGDVLARDPEVTNPDIYPRHQCDPRNQSLFACATCKSAEVQRFAPQFSDGFKCVCKYCVNDVGKSIDDGDVWYIYCLKQTPSS